MQVEVWVQVPGRCEAVECQARRCVEGERAREAELNGYREWPAVGAGIPRRSGAGGGILVDALGTAAWPRRSGPQGWPPGLRRGAHE